MTYSIIVFNPDHGVLGIGVVSGSIAVGSRVPWARLGVGGVVTQAYTNPALAPIILNLIEKGYSCREAIYKALENDPEPTLRQIAVMKWGGSDKAYYNGEGIPEEYSGYMDEYCVAVANLVVSKEIPRIMCRTYNGLREAGLVEAILEALREAHLLGGDKRGDTSATLLVIGETPYGRKYDRIIDLRVDYSKEPVKQLTEIYRRMRVRI